MSRLLAFVVTIILSLAAPLAGASFHTFEIDRLYSNADGTIQYIVLRETAGMSGQQFLRGHELTSTHAGRTKTMAFPNNLPSSSTGGRQVLIATPGFAALGLVTPDYTIPAGFLPTDGGTVDYAFVSTMTYTSLPTDGVSALRRSDGAVIDNVATNFAGASASAPALPVSVVEYYNQTLDHYFISALQPDIDALDSGRLVGWVRTGETFKVYPSQAAGGPGVNPVCRILIPPPADSHFFSAVPQECAETLAKFPFMQFESPAVFYIAVPVMAGPTAGTCPAGTIPVYRLFNHRSDPNHRYTVNRALRDQLVGRGYEAEGYGNDPVIMCALA